MIKSIDSTPIENIKITQITPTLLKLKIQNDTLIEWFFSLFLIFGGLFAMSSNRKVLECNRFKSQQIDCEITSFNVLGQKVEIIPINNLRGAEVERRFQTNNSNGKFRVVIKTNNDKIPLNVGWSSGSGTEYFENRTASQINSFLQQSEKKYFKTQGSNWIIYLFHIFGLLLILVGSQFLIEKHSTGFIFDKDTRKVLIMQKNLLMLKSELKNERLLKEIKMVEVTKDVVNDEDNYTISLVMLTHEQIILQSGTIEENYNIKENYDEIAQCINQFLDIKS